MADRYENVGGPHHRADGTEVKRGDTFEPTPHELNRFGDKFEAVSTSAPVTGADIGIRSLDWGSDAALRAALDADPPLSEGELRAVEPSGVHGYITADVEAALRARE